MHNYKSFCRKLFIRILLFGVLAFFQTACEFDIQALLGSSDVTPTQGPRTSTPNPISPTLSTTPTFPSTISPQITPNPTQILGEAFEALDSQFRNLPEGNIAFNKPGSMKKDSTTVIELVLSFSDTQENLATQIIERGDLATSTAEPGVLIDSSGEVVSVETSSVEITPRMKAVLISRAPDAFVISEMHDSAEQVVLPDNMTAWRWSITAKKEGSQTLELILYQLIKYDGKEFWHEVETYKADIVVEVTLAGQIKAIDWKWLAGAILIPLTGVAWGWWRSRNKKPDVLQVKIVEEKKNTNTKKREP